jgi:hypothetical protein
MKMQRQEPKEETTVERFKHNSALLLETLTKALNTNSQERGRDSNQVRPEYKTITLWPHKFGHLA